MLPFQCISLPSTLAFLLSIAFTPSHQVKAKIKLPAFHSRTAQRGAQQNFSQFLIIKYNRYKNHISSNTSDERSLCFCGQLLKESLHLSQEGERKRQFDVRFDLACINADDHWTTAPEISIWKISGFSRGFIWVDSKCQKLFKKTFLCGCSFLCFSASDVRAVSKVVFFFLWRLMGGLFLLSSENLKYR